MIIQYYGTQQVDSGNVAKSARCEWLSCLLSVANCHSRDRFQVSGLLNVDISDFPRFRREIDDPVRFRVCLLHFDLFVHRHNTLFRCFTVCLCSGLYLFRSCPFTWCVKQPTTRTPFAHFVSGFCSFFYYIKCSVSWQLLNHCSCAAIARLEEVLRKSYQS